MGQFLLLVVVALTVGAVVFGVTVLLTGSDPGLSAAEPDGRAVPLPGTRPLIEDDIEHVRFDTSLRGYRMAQVDQAMRRAAYDIGYKDELINVLEAEVAALRSGRLSDAEVLRRAREAARSAAGATVEPTTTEADAEADSADETGSGAEATVVAVVGADEAAEGGPSGTGGSSAGEPDADSARADSPVVVPMVVPVVVEPAESPVAVDPGEPAVSEPVPSEPVKAEPVPSEPVKAESVDLGEVESAGARKADVPGVRQTADGETPQADAASDADPSTVLPGRR
jgi:DivIVA domain-containing protein